MSKKHRRRNQETPPSFPANHNRKQKTAKFAENQTAAYYAAGSPLENPKQERSDISPENSSVEIIGSSEQGKSEHTPDIQAPAEKGAPDNKAAEHDTIQDNDNIPQAVEMRQDRSEEHPQDRKENKSEKSEKTDKPKDTGRMKKAAYARQIAQEKIEDSRTAVYADADPEPEKPQNTFISETPEKKDIPREAPKNTAAQDFERKTISPEIADKMKKAAFVKQMLERKNADGQPQSNSEDYSEEHTPHITEESAMPAVEESPRRESKTEDIHIPFTEKNISPEKAEQLKKAAFIKQRLEEKNAVAQVQTAAEDVSEEHHAAHNSEDSILPISEETPKREKKSEDINIPYTEKNISPENAARLKKAAYYKRMNAEKISENRTAAYSEETPESTAQADNPDNSGNTDIPQDNDVQDPAGTESKSVIYDDVKEKISAELKAEQYKRSHSKNRQEDKDKRDTRSGSVIETAENAAEVIGAVKSGDANNVLALPAKHFIKKGISDNANSALGGISTIAGTVKNSDSAGGAAANIGTALAGNEVKKYVINRLKNQRDILSAERKSKKYHFLDNKKTAKKINAKAAEKYKKENFIKTQLARRKEAKRRAQAKEFLKQNGGTISFGAKMDIYKALAKKKAAKYVAGAGAGLVIPVLIVIAVVPVIAGLFSWLAPFEYVLAGSDSDTPTGAQTEEEVLNGYTLMIQNYMDVAQAYYYLEYGDWYGGTYVYPSSGIDFSTFYSEFCSDIITQIQEQYMAMIAAATTPQQINALYNAMGQAINAALANAQTQALAAYQQLCSQLDDELTADENRQPYEITRTEGGNGTSDNAEFDGKPIVGTNNFGNLEIQSDLSAEELLAMTALYKSLKLMQTGGQNEDGSEYTYNITPEDIMTFFKETEYIPITTEITHDNECAGQNCKRRLTDGNVWEYYCDGDHDNLSGQIDPCISKDDLLQKIMELTEAEDKGFNTDSCNDMFDEYLKYIKKTLNISESDYHKFGAEDNERAQEFYETLIDPAAGEIPNNFWEIDTPIGESEDE